FERVNELAQSEHRFVAESVLQLALLFIIEPVRTNRAIVGNADQDRISSDVLRAAVHVSAGVIDVAPVLDADQIRDLGDVIGAPVEPRERAWLGKPIHLTDLFERHRLEAFVNVILMPGYSVRGILGLIERDAFALEVLRESFDDRPNGLERKREIALGAEQQRTIGQDPAVTTGAVGERNL